jgi:hypothetical protein
MRTLQSMIVKEGISIIILISNALQYLLFFRTYKRKNTEFMQSGKFRPRPKGQEGISSKKRVTMKVGIDELEL